MRLKVAAVSDRGKIRSVNEDNMFIHGEFLPEIHRETAAVLKNFSSLEHPLFCVFDGMGGYDAGEKASFLAASVAGKLRNEKLPFLKPGKLLPEICKEANNAICNEMLRLGNVRMGTTAAMILFAGKRYFLCNVGDSPIFLLRNGILRELSVEHTERATYESITGRKSDPKKKFKLTQNIGMFPTELILEPYYADGALQAEDVFLLCSDGVTDMLDKAQIAEILRRSDVSAAARELLDRALEAGGKDNITAVVVRCCKRSCVLGRLKTDQGRNKLW